MLPKTKGVFSSKYYEPFQKARKIMQFDLFVDELKCNDIKFKLVEDKLEKVKVSNDNVRKGIFARHNELSKMYIEMKQKYDEMHQELLNIRRDYVHNHDRQTYIYAKDVYRNGILFDTETISNTENMAIPV